jgi:hypothetical protein
MQPNLKNLEKLMNELTAAQQETVRLDLALLKKQQEWLVEKAKEDSTSYLKSDANCAQLTLDSFDERVELTEAKCRETILRGRLTTMVALLQGNPDKW